MENNFKCSSCEEEFLIPRYSFEVKQGKTIYITSNMHQPISCPACKSLDVNVIKRKGDLTTVAYGRFSSASLEEKKEILQKRADAHKKKTEEQYRTINREYRGKTNEKHY